MEVSKWCFLENEGMTAQKPKAHPVYVEYDERNKFTALKMELKQYLTCDERFIKTISS